MNEFCFITTFWQSPANDTSLGRVVHEYFNITANGNFISSITATAFSLSFPILCDTNYTIEISTGNICGTGQNVTYMIQNQINECEINTTMIPNPCFATPAITNLTTESSNRNGQNSGNACELVNYI